MKAEHTIATYRRLREQPLWRLLAADHGPTILGLLHTHLYDRQRVLPSSVLHERIERDLEHLRDQGEKHTTAQAQIARWLNDGYLERRFPSGASEEEYELTSAAVEALRLVSSLEQPHSAATQSRLALVIQALTGLAEQTDPDQSRRIERLLAEQTRIDREIEALRRGEVRVLSDDSAHERAQEIIALAEDLISDFRRVREDFDQLNRHLRERIMDSEGNRGDVLDSVFAGIDLIGESDAGRTFQAFWRLLMDPEQSTGLELALVTLNERAFFKRLDSRERQFLRRLTANLLEQGNTVHAVSHSFARSLRHFVQSREYQQQRRLDQLLREAQRAALTVKDQLKAHTVVPLPLEQSSAKLDSVSRWRLYDPSLRAPVRDMQQGEGAPIDLAQIGALVAQSEIDLRTLKEHVRQVLETREQASIAEVLEQFPAEQGLGSIIGLLLLGSRHGIRGALTEPVNWTGTDDQVRHGRIPVVYFTRKHADELL